jgi:peptide/nickel transport system ATP-binding protein/oligopeptide transport system ATP-binding protein
MAPGPDAKAMSGLDFREAEEPLAETVDVYRSFTRRRGFLKPPLVVHAVNGVSLRVAPAEVLGLVGESGCGKSTLGRLMLGLLPSTSGHVNFEGQTIDQLPAPQMKALRRNMQVIFQDPLASLNPYMNVEDILTEPLKIHRVGPRESWGERALQLLDLVGLPIDALRRRPTQFSGGQQQRIAIARALALRPKFIVADEALSALDASIQAQILNLFVDIQAQFGISYLFISHNLTVVRHISHHIAVMYLGKVVETGTAEQVYRRPAHPYTIALLSAVPLPDPDKERRRRRVTLFGDPPDPSCIPSGCPFRTRCWKATERCSVEVPLLRDDGLGHQVACHYPEGRE